MENGYRPRSATGRQSSIGAMTASPGEEARFLTRNAVDALPDGALEKQLGEGRPLRVKLGIDPTAPDIHLGHTVVLRKLREFQDRGHTVVLIIGDYTARVGDPSGRSSTRPELSGEEIDANAETFQKQAFLVLDHDRTEVRRNGEWLDMTMEDLFKLTRTTTVAQLLERDDFAKRYAAHEPISILELLYPLLQGYDSVAIDADVEMGATDQKFNILLARDIQQAYGKPAAVHPHHADPARDRRQAEDVEVARQPRRPHRAARRGLRQAHARARRGDAASTTSCCWTRRSIRRPRPSSPSAGWRACSRRACTVTTPPARRRSTSTASTSRARCPTRSRTWQSLPPTARSTFRP